MTERLSCKLVIIILLKMHNIHNQKYLVDNLPTKGLSYGNQGSLIENNIGDIILMSLI